MSAVDEADLDRRVLHADSLLDLTAALVEVPSVSRDEKRIADLVERRLRARAPRLELHRVGDSVVARTRSAPAPGAERPPRLAFAGHLDTVPPAGPRTAAGDGRRVRGTGAVDMKGGVAVMLLLAEQAADAPVDATFVFFDKEEIGSRISGMHALFADHPELIACDFAVLLEPTGGAIEAGCQGNFVVELEFTGARAHTARPWRGSNAVHRAAAAMARIAAHTPETVEIDGLGYRQSLSIVAVAGGVQGNVVPDRCTVKVNYRHAPTIDAAAALALVLGLAPEAAGAEVLLSSPPAPPRLEHPLVRRLARLSGAPVRPKLGWTDVGRFTAAAVPAVNFGPGDSELAHSPHEVVDEDELTACHRALLAFLHAPAEAAELAQAAGSAGRVEAATPAGLAEP